MQNNPFADLIPGPASQSRLPALRQVVPPRPKTPPAQTQAQAEQDRLNVTNTREQMAERRGKKVEAQNKYRAQIDSATSDIMRVVNRLDRVAGDADDNEGWFETGRSGALMRSMPAWVGKGSAAYDIERDLDMVGANAAIDSLMEMRRNSPTGAGVGNVALGELQIMKDKIATLDPDQGHETFIRNVGEAKREFLDKLKRINPRAYKQYVSKKPAPKAQGGLPQGWSIEEE
jgi:hypothetical protein